MANYIYESVTGPVEIEVDEYWENLLKAEDTGEENAERKHNRPDHKYALGEPLSLEDLWLEGEWFSDRDSGIEDAEFFMDLGRALQSLSDLQRRYFILSRIQGYGHTEISISDSKDRTTVREVLRAADKKIKKYFEQYPPLGHLPRLYGERQ